MINLSSGKYLGVNSGSYDAGGLIITMTEYHDQVFQGWHSHENTHLTFVVSGGNREQRKTSDIDVRAGKLLFYHQDEWHRNSHTAHPSKNINLEITPAFLDTHHLSENHVEQIVQKSADVRFMLLRMYSEALCNEPLSSVSIQMLLMQLFTSTVSGKLSGSEPPWVRVLREYLQENWRGQPHLEELTGVASVHPVTISKYFSRYFGDTLGAYLRKIKIQQALTLIKAGDMPLTEVAYDCGFSDQSHFTRTFRELTHLLPKEYRKL